MKTSVLVSQCADLPKEEVSPTIRAVFVSITRLAAAEKDEEL